MTVMLPVDLTSYPLTRVLDLVMLRIARAEKCATAANLSKAAAVLVQPCFELNIDFYDQLDGCSKIR